jgi:hypothetical protein
MNIFNAVKDTFLPDLLVGKNWGLPYTEFTQNSPYRKIFSLKVVYLKTVCILAMLI